MNMAMRVPSNQIEFPFRHLQPTSHLRPGEIVVDLFAGGGGASHALEQALKRAIDIAINHNEWAIGMHAVNHPHTRHLCEDIWAADPYSETRGQLIGWLHASPDCTHHSQARGGQPRSKATRSLSWVVLKWAGKLVRHGTAPRIISLENVGQLLSWGPLTAKRDKATGRVVKLDGTVAARGERVPVQQQFLIPDKNRQGRTWAHFVRALQRLGYAVEWRSLKASDYGAGTSRQRLYMVARRDQEPIQWPEASHGTKPGQLPVVTAADCLDFTLPCPSIFLSRTDGRARGVKRPLADPTLRRIAKGMKRFVLDAPAPFIVRIGQSGSNGPCSRPVTEPLSTVVSKAEHCLLTPYLAPLTHHGADRGHDVRSPLPTITAAHRGEIAMVAPVLVQAGYGERVGQPPREIDLSKPLGVVVAGGIKHAVAAAHIVKIRGTSEGSAIDAPVPTITSGAGAKRPSATPHAMGVLTAFLEQANGGYYDGDGHAAGQPLSTITSTGTQQRLVAASMVTLRGTNVGADITSPVRTISAGGEHHGLIVYTLSPQQEAGALRVADFLIQHLPGCALDAGATVEARLALVTVFVDGVAHVIVDIGLRMLRREELFRAQGFPSDYVIDRTADGRPLSISRSVQMVGNSVSPPPLFAIAVANLDSAVQSFAREQPRRHASTKGRDLPAARERRLRVAAMRTA